MSKSRFKLPIKEQVHFVKRLSFLIHASVPILDSLNILKRQARSKGKLNMYNQIIEDISNGQFLAKSLGKFHRVFGDFAINIIHTGETSGTLDESLSYLAEELEKKQRLRRKVFGALVYPVLIVIATLGITGLLMVYIFPKLMPIFDSLQVDLPFTTRALVWLSAFLLQWGSWVILGTVGVIIFLYWLVSTQERAHYAWDRIILKIPLLGKVALSYQMANITRTLGLLLKTDIGVIDALRITSDTITNMVYKRQFKGFLDKIIHGETISSQLAKRPDIFPSLLAEMIAIGEKTGRLSDTFMYLSQLYEDDVEDLTKNLSNAIEPVLMIFMGVVVGFVAVSIITPIYQITLNLNVQR